MSTRSLVAYSLTPEGKFDPVGNLDRWTACYVHFDGYLEGVGLHLHRIGRDAFDGDGIALALMVVDEHPEGWSSLLTGPGTHPNDPTGIGQVVWPNDVGQGQTYAYEEEAVKEASGRHTNETAALIPYETWLWHEYFHLITANAIVTYKTSRFEPMGPQQPGVRLSFSASVAELAALLDENNDDNDD